MNIYVLKPIVNDAGAWDDWYDKVFCFVVVADLPSQARILAARQAGNEDNLIWLDDLTDQERLERSVWMNTTQTSCEKLGDAHEACEACVICRDYRAA